MHLWLAHCRLTGSVTRLPLATPSSRATCTIVSFTHATRHAHAALIRVWESYGVQRHCHTIQCEPIGARESSVARGNRSVHRHATSINVSKCELAWLDPRDAGRARLWRLLPRRLSTRRLGMRWLHSHRLGTSRHDMRWFGQSRRLDTRRRLSTRHWLGVCCSCPLHIQVVLMLRPCASSKASIVNFAPQLVQYETANDDRYEQIRVPMIGEAKYGW